MRTLRDEARDYVLIYVKKIKRTTPKPVRIELVEDWANIYEGLLSEQEAGEFAFWLLQRC